MLVNTMLHIYWLTDLLHWEKYQNWSKERKQKWSFVSQNNICMHIHLQSSKFWLLAVFLFFLKYFQAFVLMAVTEEIAGNVGGKRMASESDMMLQFFWLVCFKND